MYIVTPRLIELNQFVPILNFFNKKPIFGSIISNPLNKIFHPQITVTKVTKTKYFNSRITKDLTRRHALFITSTQQQWKHKETDKYNHANINHLILLKR